VIAKSDYSAGDEARKIVNDLLRLESRGAGDLEGAMRRLGNRYGLPWRTFWTIKYRHPKDLMCGVMGRLREAHAAECQRQIERLRHELSIAKINGVHVQDLEDQAATLRAELETCLEDRTQRDA
jgi:hypothetical protein